MMNNLNKIRYRIEYLDLKYPYLKFIPLIIILLSLFIDRNDIILSIFRVTAFFIAVVLHEIAHGIVAYYLGDNTAKNAGRLTLNPIKHFDLEGLLLPAMLLLFGSPIIIGSAKPVPVNYYNLKLKKLGIFLVSIAGVATNFLLVITALLLYKFIFIVYVRIFLIEFIIINIVLGVFNLVPIPPLDGSRILRLIVPRDFKYALDRIEANPFISFFLIMLLIYSNILRSVYTYVFGLLSWIL
ncbi:site-2 protease family protein [Oceanivirga salmonicida]|uniref:site-2 protease family protein n=1 Tax=Oceanivirga salmonicida TaxID=1769291 RepID=UPI000833BB40|nr:site-2 protease family protein [Oceanivirga salmonicida]